MSLTRLTYLKGRGGYNRIERQNYYGQQKGEKKKIIKKFNLALSFPKCLNHLLSDQEAQVSLKKGVFTTQRRRHGRKFVCRYFALALFWGTYQAWLLDLELMVGNKISFQIMYASHQTRSDLILQNSYLSVSHQKLLHSTGPHIRMSSTGHKEKERYSFKLCPSPFSPLWP